MKLLIRLLVIARRSRRRRLCRLVFLFPAQARVAPTTTAVTRGDIEIDVLATGTLNAKTVVSVGAEVSGHIDALHVELGETVKKGDLIAEIDPLDQQNALKIANAALQNIEAQRRIQVANYRTGKACRRAGGASQRRRTCMSEADYQTAKRGLRECSGPDRRHRCPDHLGRAERGKRRAQSEPHPDHRADGRHGRRPAGRGGPDDQRRQVVADHRQACRSRHHDRTGGNFRGGRPQCQGGPARLLHHPWQIRRPRSMPRLLSVDPAPESFQTSTSTSACTSSSSAVYYNGVLSVPNVDGGLKISMTAQVTIVTDEAENALVVPATAVDRAARRFRRGRLRSRDQDRAAAPRHDRPRQQDPGRNQGRPQRRRSGRRHRQQRSSFADRNAVRQRHRHAQQRRAWRCAGGFLGGGGGGPPPGG